MAKIDNHALPTRRGMLAGAAAASLSAGCRYEDVDVALGPDSKSVVTTVDLTVSRLVQVIGARSSAPPGSGIYVPRSQSPAFARLTPDEAVEAAGRLLGGQLNTLVNAAFFESYDPDTEFAFPVKHNGVMLTGGDSPYGPRANPADARYKSVQLHALAWSASRCAIVPFDVADGGASALEPFADAVVTYAWSDHPAVVLAGDPANRYQVAGVTRQGTLLLGTFRGASLAQAASDLREAGAVGPVLTMDGGISTCLWHEGSFVERPEKPGDAPLGLPHYLAIGKRA